LRRSERGTTLLLFPAAVLVMMMLGAIAVDLGEVQLAHRQLIREVGTAADDGADQLNLNGLRDPGATNADLTRLDPDAVRRTVLADLTENDLPGRPVGPPTVTIGPDPGVVTVTVTRDIPHIFGRAVPGVPNAERITVRLSGRIRDPGP
jgi:Flp pilus assembly protein TadG